MATATKKPAKNVKQDAKIREAFKELRKQASDMKRTTARLTRLLEDLDAQEISNQLSLTAELFANTIRDLLGDR